MGDWGVVVCLLLQVLTWHGAPALDIPREQISTNLAPVPTEHGVRFVYGSLSVELAVASVSAFRLSMAAGSDASQIPTRMVDVDQTYPAFTVTQQNSIVGINCSFGYISMDTASGAISLGDGQGTLTTSIAPAFANSKYLLSFGAKDSAEYYGAGGGLLSINSLVSNSSTPVVHNRVMAHPLSRFTQTLMLYKCFIIVVTIVMCFLLVSTWKHYFLFQHTKRHFAFAGNA